MQDASQDYLDAGSGSTRPVAVVDSWYDGELIAADLPVIGGSVTLDAGRAIHGATNLVVGSPDGTLVPRGWDAPLSPFGSEVQVRAGLQAAAGATEMFSLGWYRLSKADPDEWWGSYPDPTDPENLLWACKGVKVTADADDRLSYVDRYKFLAPEAPESLASVLTEIRRLVRDTVPVADWDDIDDAAIPATISYQASRLQAVQDLADVLGRVARMDPDGALMLYPKSPAGPAVWTVEVGPGKGKILNWNRPLDSAGLYNAAVSSGTTPEGVPVQGIVVENSGPLRWGGPFGRVPWLHSSPLITSQAAADADAETRLARLIRERVVPVVVATAPNFALLLDDIAELQLPDATLTGPVSAVTWPVPQGPMQMTVMVPADQLWG